MQERRKFVRIPCRQPLRFQEIKEGSWVLPKSTLAVDVSESGIRFHSDVFMPLASRLLLELTLPSSLKPVRAVAKPAWIKSEKNSEGCEVGAIFQEIGEDDKSLLREFIGSQVGA